MLFKVRNFHVFHVVAVVFDCGYDFVAVVVFKPEFQGFFILRDVHAVEENEDDIDKPSLFEKVSERIVEKQENKQDDNE